MVFTHNTLSQNIRVPSAELLNTHLAAAIDEQIWLVESLIAPRQ